VCLGDASTSNNRLDDRIRELSDKAVSAPQDEVEPILEELLAVVCEKLEHLGVMVATHFREGKPLKKERSS
jgi:nucleotide-binding universal stress UspA family protein